MFNAGGRQPALESMGTETRQSASIGATSSVGLRTHPCTGSPAPGPTCDHTPYRDGTWLEEGSLLLGQPEDLHCRIALTCAGIEFVWFGGLKLAG
jgi:hypothetical protein